MKPSKISENALKRSVLKNIKSKNDDVILGAEIACDYALLNADGVMATSLNSCLLWDDICIDRLFDNVILDLLCAKAKPVAVSMSLLLPDKTMEEYISHIMDYADGLALSYGVEIIGGHTEVSVGVKEPVMTLNAFGIPQADFHKPSDSLADANIVQIGRISGFATSILAKKYRDDLSEKMSELVIREAFELYDSRQVFSARDILFGPEVLCMHNASSGGIFAGLWEIGSLTGCGLEVDIKQIMIYQHTVEVCENLGLNPYTIATTDCMLALTRDGEDLVDRLHDAGIYAALIGKLNDTNNRLLKNNGEERFLEMPRGDDIFKGLGGRQ